MRSLWTVKLPAGRRGFTSLSSAAKTRSPPSKSFQAQLESLVVDVRMEVDALADGRGPAEHDLVDAAAVRREERLERAVDLRSEARRRLAARQRLLEVEHAVRGPGAEVELRAQGRALRRGQQARRREGREVRRGALGPAAAAARRDLPDDGGGRVVERRAGLEEGEAGASGVVTKDTNVASQVGHEMDSVAIIHVDVLRRLVRADQVAFEDIPKRKCRGPLISVEDRF
mmetsp:Transcript_6239/g.21277  ORF Transcript_6239/g.21277 Transcript_6239/m.21277 type:complete len:229 (+) Transcript_6239:102-788(+)